ncbi:MAG: 2-oxo acid dehydrogenase subunit E2 [Anaerolineales bacterium]|nr:2-oxo acid dehydrogenase subunit E2 [Anaerolineales bacterium]
MAKAVIMPKFGMAQEEATIVEWLVKEGDFVENDDPIAEVTTDKVNMEVGAPAEGYIRGFRFQEGDTVPVTKVIAYILKEGEEPPTVDEDPIPTVEAERTEPTVKVEPALEEVKASPVARRVADAQGVQLTQVAGSGRDGRITRADVERHLTTGTPAAVVSDVAGVRATPAARRVARERQLDLSLIPGSGPHGRVQEADAHAFQAAPRMPAPSYAVTGEPVLVPLEGMRKTIAERMQASAQNAPHISFTLNVDMSRVIAFRNSVNERLPAGQTKVSMTALIVKLTAWALRRHPFMNAYMRDDGVLLLPNVNIGVAVALESGLIVPVVRDADQKGLHQIATDVDDISQRARTGQLLPDDVAYGSFTVSNLGMFGIDQFTAIINPPQVGILAVGRTAETFVPDEQGQPLLTPILSITLSADHRAVDGAQAGRFIADLRAALEEPANIML